jgi:hypothetical protein
MMQSQKKTIGLFRELNPGPLAPEARIIPLDQTADTTEYTLSIWQLRKKARSGARV